MLNDLARECHAANQTWWHDPATGERLNRNKGELLMLIVSEISEAMEGERKDRMDDKLPHRKMVEVELADAMIRIFDYAGAFGYDLDGAVAEKRAYNAQRADHKPEHRRRVGGKNGERCWCGAVPFWVRGWCAFRTRSSTVLQARG